MDWFIFHDLSPRKRVTWSPEARAPFTRRRLAIAGHDDGIAVRLAGDRKLNALRIPGCRSLTRHDGIAVRGMVAVPWSAREHWRDLAQAAANT